MCSPAEGPYYITRQVGAGRDSDVYVVRGNGCEVILKCYMEDDGIAFWSEVKAYLALHSVASLKHRIPECIAVCEKRFLPPGLPHECGDHQAVLLEMIPGTSLNELMDELPGSILSQLKDTVAETLRLMHQFGVTHGDVQERNIMLLQGFDDPESAMEEKVVLIDFCSSRTIQSCTPEIWERQKQLDFDFLYDTFRSPEFRRNTSQAIAITQDPDFASVHLQTELVRLLKVSRRTRPLLRALRKVPLPIIPSLAVGISRMLTKRGNETARGWMIIMLEEYTPPSWMPSSSYDDRAVMKLEAERARLEKDGDTAGQLYLDLAAKSEAFWGPRDAFTMKMRRRASDKFEDDTETSLAVDLELLLDIHAILKANANATRDWDLQAEHDQLLKDFRRWADDESARGHKKVAAQIWSVVEEVEDDVLASVPTIQVSGDRDFEHFSDNESSLEDEPAVGDLSDAPMADV